MKHRTIIVFAVVVALAGAVAIAGCAPHAESGPDSADASPGASDGQKASVAWTPGADCGACHAKEASSAGEPGCLAQAHANEGSACADCHVDEQALSAVHERSADAAPAGKLKATDVGDDACLACHESREALAAKTADVVLSDDRGTAVNPHELAPSPDHDAIACADCHVSHEGKPALEEAQGTCASCHHAGVFECGTCHT